MDHVHIDPNAIRFTGRPATILKALVRDLMRLDGLRKKHKKMEYEGEMDDWECALADILMETVKVGRVQDTGEHHQSEAHWRGITFKG